MMNVERFRLRQRTFARFPAMTQDHQDSAANWAISVSLCCGLSRWTGYPARRAMRFPVPSDSHGETLSRNTDHLP
jgi:hypothetical protein